MGLRGPPRAGLTGSSFLVLGILLALPGYALSRWAGVIDWRVLVGAPVAMSAFAFLAYRSDKLRATTGGWRVPEVTLQVTALLGGWPGAFLAQRIYRHKTAKASFLAVYWIIVAVHQYLALDSLLAWRLARAAALLVRSWLG
ncbi:MAG: DUF1294 domain-containing protein [Opitutaceae bacterium]|nr:DUF1294 domain-containing protein [Opitutaceae bacterium]